MIKQRKRQLRPARNPEGKTVAKQILYIRLILYVYVGFTMKPLF